MKQFYAKGVNTTEVNSKRYFKMGTKQNKICKEPVLHIVS